MELIKAKYKETEVGLIPEDWEVISIDEAIKTTQLGGNYQNSESENDCPLMKMGNLDRGFFKFNKIEYVVGQEPSKRDLLNYGDVIFNTRNTLDLVGKVAVWKNELDKAYFNSNLLRFEFDESKISSSFFFNYLINTKRNISQLRSIATGTTSVAAIYSRDLTKVLIAKPTLTEQKVIATALSDVDDLIANLDKLITKKKAIKQGAMQQLLTPPNKGGKRLAGFTGEWVEKKLGDVAQMNSGGTPSSKVSEYYNGDINWVSITDMTNTGKYIISSGKKITEEGLQNSSARLFPKDTVLLAMYASIGKCTIAKAEVTTSQAILGITVNNSLDIEYLYYYLIYKKDELISQGQQGTQSNLNKGMVQNIIMCLPQIKEQNAIAKILSDMDLDIEQLETKKTKYQDIKQGMMQELLTGKTRLV